MKNKVLLLIVSIGVIILIVSLLHFAKEPVPAGESHMDGETEPSVSPPDLILEPNEPDDGVVGEYTVDPGSYPYHDMIFANDAAFAFIKEAYDKVDFYGEYKEGHADEYGYYTKKYHSLLHNEVPFNDKMGKETYLNDYVRAIDLYECTYYYFDIDDDGAPELCVKKGWYVYIFKYIKDTDTYVLWYELGNSYYFINGTKKIRWDRFGERHVFYWLDINGNEEYSVRFGAYGFNIKPGTPVYTVALPGNTERAEIDKEVKGQAYYEKSYGLYHFRVTEKQYDILTRDYFAANIRAAADLPKVTYTYEALFGDLP